MYWVTREELAKKGRETGFKSDPVSDQAVKFAGKMSVKDICLKFGISEVKLRAAARYRKISLAFDVVGQIKKTWSEKEVGTMKRLSKTMTAKQVGDILGRSESSVKSKAAAIKVSFLKTGDKCSWSKYSNEDIELCRKLDDVGMKPVEIAEKMEIELSHLCKVLKYESRHNG